MDKDENGKGEEEFFRAVYKVTRAKRGESDGVQDGQTDLCIKKEVQLSCCYFSVLDSQNSV